MCPTVKFQCLNQSQTVDYGPSKDDDVSASDLEPPYGGGNGVQH